MRQWTGMPTEPVELLLRTRGPLVIAHRGASVEAPETTMAAFERAVALGADAIELDVRVTADDDVVVLHDPTLLRTTGISGAVEAMTTRAVHDADAGSTFSPDGGRSFPFRERNVRVPLLAEVLEAFPHTPLLVEVKTVRAMQALEKLVRRHGAAGRVVPASEHHGALTSFRADPFHCGASRRDIARLYFGALVGAPLPRRGHYGLLAVPYRWRGLEVPTRGFIRAAHRLGAAVHVWTVDDPAEARRLWERGVSGIVTNDPGTMLAARGALGSRQG